jgi:hypothetical protein
LKIYIYGSKSFKKEMVSLMIDSNLSNIVNEIDDIDTLENTIKNYPDDIYLIHSDKIVSKNMITDKLKLKSKDSIYKQTLEAYGIDDICFNSNEALINYIIDKIDKQDCKIQDDDIKEEIDMGDITQIDEMREDDVLNALDTTISAENKQASIAKIKDLNDDSTQQKLEITNSNIDDISELLRQLLNNKTVELSIKIKD